MHFKFRGKSFFPFFLLLCIPMMVFGQFSKKEEKQLEKANDKYTAQNYSDAEKIYREILKNHPNSNILWDHIVKCAYGEYAVMKDLKFTISTSSKSKTNNDSLDKLTNNLQELLNPKKFALDAFLGTCKEAELVCEVPETASMYLRIFLIDKNIDSNVNESAIRWFNKAENEFQKRNYETTRKYYQKALDIQPNYYKAKLYLGDIYYQMKEYSYATKYFREVIQTYPHELEPRKYLVDALAKANEYDKALTEAIDAVLVYPDAGMMWKIDDISTILNKKFNRHWIPRGAAINKTDTSTSFFKESVKKAEGPWKYYVEAIKKVSSYCNKNGTLSKNPITKENYLEVYCWSYMLENTKDPIFDHARKMKDEDLLDCYVLLSLFNQDLYDQQQDFVANNHDKARKYFDLCLSNK